MFNTLCKIISILFILLTVTAYPFEQEIPDPVKTKIITNTKNVKPGEKIKVAIYFKLDPGWHIYWKNPGDSGLPTKVKYTAPNGFDIKKTYYPVPKTFIREGNILDYGYEDELLLIADIYVPENNVLNRFTINSEVNWVVCKEVCIIGTADFNLDYPITNKEYLEDETIFKKWESQVPKKLSRDNLPFKYSVEKRFNAENKLSFMKISFNWNKEISELNIFPNTDRSIYLKDIELKNENLHSSYSFSPVIFKKDKKDIEEMEFVISYKDSNGITRGIETILELDS